MLFRICIVVALAVPCFIGCDEGSTDDQSLAARPRKRRKKSGPLPPPLTAAELAEKSQSKGSKKRKGPIKKKTPTEETALPKQSSEPSKSTQEKEEPGSAKPGDVEPGDVDPGDSDPGETLVKPLPETSPGSVEPSTPDGDDPTEEFLAEVTPAVRQARMDDATNFLCAVCLGHSDPTTVQRYLRWSPALKRPVMSITWGLGVRVKYPKANEKGVPDVRWRLTGDVRALKGGLKPQVPLAKTWGYFTGELGSQIYTELITRINNGDFGQAYAVASKSSTGGQFRRINDRYPGLTWLGQEGPSRGNNARVDLMLTISLAVTSKGSEQGGWYSDVAGSPALRDMRTGKSLGRLKTVSTRDISRAGRKQGKSGGNLLDEYVAEFTQYIDENIAVKDFPTQKTPELEKKAIFARCKKLAARPKNKYSLIELAELQYYHSKGQINDAAKAYAFKEILGDDRGKKLASGTQEQKITVLRQLAPKIRAAK
ncbi:MAG: hypothetical protein IIA67_01935 [Planctomycetes bacterium]|nr:hypothetical protein [Planctomycetota bacterium]